MASPRSSTRKARPRASGRIVLIRDGEILSRSKNAPPRSAAKRLQPRP